ncbi:XdhC family protein [Georgenia subflava]|uniref:XshC-Cox1 family protein n=1 Tax=Georgenia subflava TaxID=1622177 RepID=A0A6N7EDR8_9MICO|nr:XdhC family protein [Georgenia subflava]MPV35481.1 XshC-Cox1 family protein [Georgenia subflava]
MQDILEQVRDWAEPYAVATVVRTWRSSPRQPGAAMAVDVAGKVVGSVSGGCVEGDLYLRCQDVLATGEAQLAHYGVSDDDAFAVGLTCGGELEVLVHRVDPTGPVKHLADAVAHREPAALATVVRGPQPGAQLLVVDGERRGTTGNPQLDRAVVTDALGLLEHGSNRMIHLGLDGEGRKEEVAVFVESYAPPPRMLIFGAIDFAAALARLGTFLGYHVTVCDARSVFATAARFPEADEVVVAWPHDYLAATDVDARTVICVLTHDPKFDVPVLEEALRTDAAYIGVMGSRRTHDDRNARLRERGLDEEQLARLRSPIGLDLGGRTPEETAVSIGAEIIASRWGGSGLPLSQIATPIHGDHVRSRRRPMPAGA